MQGEAELEKKKMNVSFFVFAKVISDEIFVIPFRSCPCVRWNTGQAFPKERKTERKKSGY